MQINETHNKIVEILRNKGPSLPVNISKQMNMSSLFVSAFLSELTNEKRIKVSHLKVGGSPLYFVEGQEEQLEPFYKYLHPREAETFLILKKHKILKDSEQDPATRVALRSIRDFAIGFKKDEEIFWRYILIPESEAKELLTEKPIKKTATIKSSKNKQTITITKSEFQNPLIIKEKPKKQKQKSEFIQRIIDFLNKNNLKIIEEMEYKVKEYNCIIQINSQLGAVNFLTQAKDKKTISETDLKKLLSNSQKIPIPCFLLYTGELSQKAKEYIKEYPSILKVKKIT